MPDEIIFHHRHFLRFGDGPWKEVTQEEWISAERSAGFHPKGEDRGQYATAGFGGNHVNGRTLSNQATEDQYAWDPAFCAVAWPKEEVSFDEVILNTDSGGMKVYEFLDAEVAHDISESINKFLKEQSNG